MKAIVVHAPGGPEVLQLEDRPIPEVSPGRVLIRVRAFGLNRSEMFTRQGQSGDAVKFPRITRKGSHDTKEPSEDEKIDAEEFVARVLVQIPEPRRHLVRYYGAYSNAARGKRRKAEAQLGAHASSGTSEEALPTSPERAALRRRWANLIRRVYEVDPLVCPRCGGEMRVVSFITEPALIRRILDHLRKREKVARPPPRRVHQPVASTT